MGYTWRIPNSAKGQTADELVTYWVTFGILLIDLFHHFGAPTTTVVKSVEAHISGDKGGAVSVGVDGRMGGDEINSFSCEKVVVLENGRDPQLEHAGFEQFLDRDAQLFRLIIITAPTHDVSRGRGVVDGKDEIVRYIAALCLRENPGK